VTTPATQQDADIAAFHSLMARGLRARKNIDGTERELLDVIAATVAYANHTRQKLQLADTVTMTVDVPYDPPMRQLWEDAEPLLAQEYIGLDWHRWQRWTVERERVGDDFAPAAFVQSVKGEWRISLNRLIFAAMRRLEGRNTQACPPDHARTVAAFLLAAADEAERLQEIALNGTVVEP
jgi:hypothetical protein